LQKLRDDVQVFPPGVHIHQLNVSDPRVDDDGLWFATMPGYAKAAVQIESPNGNCPFLIESDIPTRGHRGND